MNIIQIAQIAALVLVVVFGLLGLALLIAVFVGREQKEKVVVVEEQRGFFDTPAAKAARGAKVAPAAPAFSFPARTPVNPTGPAANGALPPTLRARPLSPQEMLSSISDDETNIDNLKRPTDKR